MTESSKRVAVYVRISADADDDREGVERQRVDCLARVEREGWSLVEVHEDNDFSASGSTRKVRPAYAQMLESARAGAVDLILAYSNSRLTRRPMELEDLITLHAETGVSVKTVVSGDDDLSTADGRMVARYKAVADAAEAERTSERRKRQSASKRAQGRHQGRRPFGWTGSDDRGRLTAEHLDPVEGPALADAIAQVLAGRSVSSIARDWNGRGITTASGNTWDLTNLRLVLCRWRNAGVVDHQGKPVEGVDARWTPVCTREALETVRAILTAPERRSGKPGPTSTTLLASVAQCGKCGRVMVSGSQRASRKAGAPKVRTYRCTGAQAHQSERCFLTVTASGVDSLVSAKIRERLLFGDLSSLGPSAGERETLETLSAERSDLDAEERAIGDMLARRVMSLISAEPALSAIVKRRAEVDQSIEQIRAGFALSSLLGDPVVTEDNGIKRASFDRAAEIVSEWTSLDVSQQREILKVLFNVTVNPGRDLKERVIITPK